MTTYLVLAGDEPWDTINGLWAVVKETDFRPDDLYILSEEREYISSVNDNIKKILDHYNIDLEINTYVIGEEEPREKIESILNKKGDEKIVIDITGGTKYLSADVLVHSDVNDFANIFCLFYLDEEHMSVPYPSIDKTRVELKDIKVRGDVE